MPRTSRQGAAEDALHALLLARQSVGGSTGPLNGIPIDLGHPGDGLQTEHIWIQEDSEGAQAWETTMGADGQKEETIELQVSVWSAQSDGTYQTVRDRGLELAGEVELAIRESFTLGGTTFQAEVTRVRKSAAVGDFGRALHLQLDVSVLALLSP